MRKKNIAKLLFIFMTVGAFSSLTAQDLSKYQKVLESTDHFRDYSGSDLSATMTMVRSSEEKGTEVKEMKTFRRDSDDAFVSVTLSPEVQKGQGILKIDGNFWRYDPESDKFTHSSKESRYSDSEVRNEDMVKPTMADSYTVVKATENQKLGSYTVTILELEPNSSNETWGGVKLFVDPKSNLILKREDYGTSGTLLRSSYYTKYVQLGSKYYPTITVFQDELIKANKTQISVSAINTDPLPDSVFNKAYLESISK